MQREAGREGIWQFKSQTAAEYSNLFYLLAPEALRAQIHGARYGARKDEETEIWRGRQRSSTAATSIGLELRTPKLFTGTDEVPSHQPQGWLAHAGSCSVRVGCFVYPLNDGAYFCK
jgi:hypothetical protein